MTKFYIGCKQVEAWRADKEGQIGYAVKYPDGYLSWSPKAVFEAAYLPMGEVNADHITQEMVDAFVGPVRVETRGKTTIVHATLANGFELVESSSCVSAENYDERLGADICLGKIKDRVWLLLGFLLQTARAGVKPAPA